MLPAGRCEHLVEARGARLVEPAVGLVQHEQLRLGQQCAGEGQALPLALRERGRRRVRVIREAGRRQRVSAASAPAPYRPAHSSRFSRALRPPHSSGR